MEEKHGDWENNRIFANKNQGAMAETRNRRLPVGIQSFEKIRKDGYLYVDKTDIIWRLANTDNAYNYLSRPRRCSSIRSKPTFWARRSSSRD